MGDVRVKLRLKLRRTKVGSSGALRSPYLHCLRPARHCWDVRGLRWSGFATLGPCNPPTVCLPCLLCCLGRLLNVQLCRGFVLVIKSVEVGGGLFHRLQPGEFPRGCFGRRPAVAPSWIIAWMRGLTAVGAPKCAGAATSRALLYPIPDSALSVACVTLSSVKPGKSRSRDRWPNLVVDFCSPLFLNDSVALHSQDVVDAANSQTLPEAGKFRLRVLTQLNSLVHGANDICLGRELARFELSWSNRDSERGASSGSRGDFGHVLHVANPPLKRHCIQVVHAVDDFCFSVGSAALRLWRWRRRLPASTSAPRSGDAECHHRPCTTSPPGYRTCRGSLAPVLLWATPTGSWQFPCKCSA